MSPNPSVLQQPYIFHQLHPVPAGHPSRLVPSCTTSLPGYLLRFSWNFSQHPWYNQYIQLGGVPAGHAIWYILPAGGRPHAPTLRAPGWLPKCTEEDSMRWASHGWRMESWIFFSEKKHEQKIAVLKWVTRNLKNDGFRKMVFSFFLPKVYSQVPAVHLPGCTAWKRTHWAKLIKLMKLLGGFPYSLVFQIPNVSPSHKNVC